MHKSKFHGAFTESSPSTSTPSTRGLLDSAPNSLVDLCTGDRLVGGKREAAELSVADFDGSRWKLVCTPDQPNIATVHLDVGGWAEIEKVGGRDVLESLYAGISRRASSATCR